MEKHSMPKVGIGVYYNVGSHDEKWGQKGINTLVFRLMHEGTEKYPSDKIDKLFKKNSMGGDNFWWADKDMCQQQSELPIGELEFGLDLESDRMQNIVINAKSLSKIKNIYKLDYDDYQENTSQWRSNNTFKDILPDSHPYKIDSWGLWEQIDTLSVETCQQHYRQYFAPNNAVLVIVGDINPENTTKLIYKYFGAIEISSNIPPDPNFLFDTNVGKEIPSFAVVSPFEPFYEQWLYINFFMPSSRNDDTMILNHLEKILTLDINKNGELAKRFTKDRWLSDLLFTGSNTSLGPSGFYIHGMNIMKNVSPHKFKKTVLNTFKYIAQNGVDKNILSEYKKSELLKLYDENTNYKIITNRIGRSEIINGDYHFYNKTFDLLENLSNEDIKRVVNTYLIENNMYMVELDVNLQKKKWYRQIGSYIIHSTIWRMWNPFIEEF